MIAVVAFTPISQAMGTIAVPAHTTPIFDQMDDFCLAKSHLIAVVGIGLFPLIIKSFQYISSVCQ